MLLTILMAIGLVLLGGLGLARGLRRGLVAVAGTLLAAVLLDLWQDRWQAWVITTFPSEQPALPIFLVFAGIFLLVALLIGYGGSTLLPRQSPKFLPPSLLERLLGGLVGALNGALIASYLLRYAEQAWANGAAAELVSASILATTLDAWLPWFMLAVVGATGIFVLVRVGLRFMQALNAPPPRPIPPASRTVAGPPVSPPTAATYQQLNEKIAQALQEQKK